MPCEDVDVPPTEPEPLDMIHELREALGLRDCARPESPMQIWKETLEVARQMASRVPVELQVQTFLQHLKESISYCDHGAIYVTCGPCMSWLLRG